MKEEVRKPYEVIKVVNRPVPQNVDKVDTGFIAISSSAPHICVRHHLYTQATACFHFYTYRLDSLHLCIFTGGAEVRGKAICAAL